MADIGKYNTLRVEKEVDFGIYLDGGDLGEILMPKRYVPENTQIDDELKVFLYLDSEDRLVATTEEPFVQVGEFACLEVASVSEIGAFLSWGVLKDLLLPFREQKKEVEEGQIVFVYVYLDAESKRIVASSKIDKHIDNMPVYYKPDDEVDIIVWAKTDLGYKVVIENLYCGLLYKNEVFQKLEPGQKLMAFIKKVREDEKIDLSLQKPGFEKIDASAQKLLDFLHANNGAMPYNDKSPAEDIATTFNISKKTFKKAIGALYRSKLITVGEDGIKVVK